MLPPLRISLIFVLLGTGGFTPGAVTAGFRIPLGVFTSSLILLLLLVCFSFGLSQPEDYNINIMHNLNIHVNILKLFTFDELVLPAEVDILGVLGGERGVLFVIISRHRPHQLTLLRSRP